MGSRSLTNIVTPNSIALNAYIYGYAGHSIVTPHAPLQQIWWTQERIDARVTPDFVASRLRKEERGLLHKPLAFGEGLTNDTYMEWILERARRLFLILADIGVPDQIFGVIDDSWDDEDLPIPLDTVERLALSYDNDEQLNRKFYHAQFTFLLRELRRGSHIAYGANEVIPLEYVHKLPPAVSLQHWSRVHLPKKPDEVFVRRRISLDSDAGNTLEEFRRDIETARLVQHDHIAPVWASYTAKGNAFFLTPFVGQHTLKSFIDHRSAPQYMKLSKPERCTLLLGWLHCLADAVATLHRHGICHGAIRPSNILIDADNNIAFSDIGTLKTLQKDKKSIADEVYTYAAPESSTSDLESLDPPASPNVAGRRTSHASSLDSERSSQRSRSSSRIGKRSLVTSPTLAAFDFGFTKPAKGEDIATAESEHADVFSLGCIFLDILTFMLKKKNNEFVKHRSTKQKGLGRGSSRMDSSFHANSENLNTWIAILDKIALEHEHLQAVRPLLQLLQDMLQSTPSLRPSAYSVVNRVRDILLDFAGMGALHCRAHAVDIKSELSSDVCSHVIESSDHGDTHTDVESVAETATLRHSVADSTSDSVTVIDSPHTLTCRPKSTTSMIDELSWDRRLTRLGLR